MDDKKALVIFMKLPEPGKVKTRLGRTIGTEKPASIYKKLAESTIKSCKSDKYDTFVCIEPYEKLEEFRIWLGADIAFIPQNSGDLGEKLLGGFKQIFAKGYTSCAVIGSDVPKLSHDVIERSFDSLNSADCAIGPAEDGGYYLIAFRKDTFEPSVFKNMEWSTNRVYNITISRLTDCGLSYAANMILPDIDTEDDLIKLRFDND